VRVACTHCQKACKKCSNTRYVSILVPFNPRSSIVTLLCSGCGPSRPIFHDHHKTFLTMLTLMLTPMFHLNPENEPEALLTTRPCERCTKYGLKDCIDSTRKPRKTGIKRYVPSSCSPHPPHCSYHIITTQRFILKSETSFFVMLFYESDQVVSMREGLT